MVDGHLGRIAVLQARDLVGREREDIGDVARLPIPHLDAERGDEDEAAEPVATLHRHLGRDPAAERGPDHGHVAEVPLGEDVEVEVGQVVDGIDARDVGRTAEAGMRGREHAAVRREQVEERRAWIEAFLAVEPEDRPPLPSLDDLQPYTMHGHPAGVGHVGGHSRSDYIKNGLGQE